MTLINESEKKDQFLFKIITTSTNKKTKERELSSANDSLNIWAKLSTAQEYLSLKNLISSDISSLQRNVNSSRFLVLLKDKKNQIQAMASVSEEESILYVDNILSAAWNISPASGKKGAALKDMQVTGAGTALIQKICAMAKQKLKSRVEAHAIPSATRFYKNHLQWKESAVEPNLFFFSFDDSSPSSIEV